MAARILIVDDDRHVTEILSRYLQDEGYETATGSTATAGAELAAACKPDLVLLDLRLPDAAGMDAFARIREASRAPVIMLTACDEEVQKVLGLELGADDYVTKPFSPREVVARIRTVLRRVASGAAETPGVQRMGELEIDRDSYEVRVAGREIALRPTEFRILSFLASRPGRIFPRSELLDALGADTDIVDRTLDKHMTNLRRKIEADPKEPRYIQTVYGVGYKMAGHG